MTVKQLVKKHKKIEINCEFFYFFYFAYCNFAFFCVKYILVRKKLSIIYKIINLIDHTELKICLSFRKGMEHFMANKLFQDVITRMGEDIDREIGVIDEVGVVVAATVLEDLGSEFNYPDAKHSVQDEKTFVTFELQNSTGYAVYVDGDDQLATQFANLIAISLENISLYHNDRYDKTSFIKNVVTDNILPGDIYAKARELHFTGEVPRVVLLIRTHGNNDGFAYDAISTLFPEKQKDFVFTISEQDTVLVKETKRNIDSGDIDKLAGSIIDTLSGVHYIKASVGIGLPITGIKELATSFKEARMALEIGRIFEKERNIINYSHLGIARLIYQLPTTLCEMFLREVFHVGNVDSLDSETLFTIQRFFENNLNVSETSRGLFVHRNTLVYRLEKIKKLTGLDLREFDDAILFNVALMVKKYLSVTQEQ